MLVLAHRGYHAKEPENTLPAFEAALHLGADGIETDVQVDRDGVPILFHDLRLQGRRVATYSRAELSQLVGYEVPTLARALDAWPEVFWNLEIKMPTVLGPIWAMLRQSGSQRRLLVSSFRHPVALHAGQALGLPCGLLVARPWIARRSLLRTLPANLPRERLFIVWESSRLREKTVAAFSAAGISSFAYGPTTLADHRHLAGWGLAGLITDHPTLGLEARRIIPS